MLSMFGAARVNITELRLPSLDVSPFEVVVKGRSTRDVAESLGIGKSTIDKRTIPLK